MCRTIFINKGEKDIETPRDFLEHFGFAAPKSKHYNDVDLDSCLCQVDIEKAFKEKGINYVKDEMGDYYL